ncbi:MAG: hypothetical protein P1U74_02550 [Legionellaceae bacterium]|nr:hypothetical protein [Legionellaceae bacterium]
MKYDFIKNQRAAYPINILCKVMNVSRSAYYAWDRRPAQLITETEWQKILDMQRLISSD